MCWRSRISSEIRQCRGLAEGKSLHSQILASGLCDETYLCNLLLQMYGRCKSVQDAKAVFDQIPQKNNFSWSLLVTAYAQNGHPREALAVFKQTDLEGFQPDRCSFLSALRACSKLGSLADGQEIHRCAASMGIDSSNVLVGTAILDMYAKCGNLQEARAVFDLMQERDVILWTAMIVAYAQEGYGREALDLFRRMELEGVKIDKYVFGGALAACGTSKNLAEGKALHRRAVDCGLESDVVLATGLCSMYAKCGSLEDARGVFSRMGRKDLVSWNSMIAAFAQRGHYTETLKLFEEMQQLDVAPDLCTFTTVLGACSALQAPVEQVRSIHARVAARGLEQDKTVAIALIDAYARCGSSVSDSWEVFLKALEQHSRVVILWNAMMGAYAQHGHSDSVLELLKRMDLEGVMPNEVTFLSLLTACTLLGDLVRGKQIQARISAAGYYYYEHFQIEGGHHQYHHHQEKLNLATAMVNMYAKCGRPEEASEVFSRMNRRDTVAWNAIIAAHAQHGDAEQVLQLFQMLNLEGAVPDYATITSVLHACSHSGKISDAKCYFSCMEADYGIVCGPDHVACLIDGLARAGKLDEAEEIVNSGMRSKADDIAWTALLGGSNRQGNLEKAQAAAKQVATEEAATYVLVSNTFSNL